MEKTLEKTLRAIAEEWRRKKQHSAAFKVSFYLDPATNEYDWRKSEERRQQIKASLGFK